MIKRLIAIAASAAAALALASLVSVQPMAGSGVDVMIGGDPNYDACGSLGVVAGLNPQGDNFLAVRSGPGTKYDQIDSLFSGNEVFLCDQRGRWHGIVYGTPGADCGVSSPVAGHQAYFGSCRSGWVFDRYIRVIAG